jgi:hypothetical protein
VDVAVIGAVAYRTWVQDAQRVTEDVDLVVGLDLSDLGRLTERCAPKMTNVRPSNVSSWTWRLPTGAGRR